MKMMFQPKTFVDAVSSSLGPLYVTVSMAGTQVEAMVDTGSSKTIISFDFSERLGRKLESLRRHCSCPIWCYTTIAYRLEPKSMFCWSGRQVCRSYRQFTTRPWSRRGTLPPRYQRGHTLGLMMPAPGVKARG